ncbi:MAG: hypothetical protein CR984_06520 [Proteobacteria bacterium]|nr:MAG: hypothetical protein CR984_06520 [Pseudomonadota bacterium]
MYGFGHADVYAIVKIQLDLKRHCIETEIKRRHEDAMTRYFKKAGNREHIERELVLLEAALTVFDFRTLRSQWPMLAGGQAGDVYLSHDPDGRPFLMTGGKCVHPPVK